MSGIIPGFPAMLGVLLVVGPVVHGAPNEERNVPSTSASAPSTQPATSSGPTSASSPSTRSAKSSGTGDIDLLSLDVPTVVPVVTAARRKQKLTAVPYAMSVITADDIRSAGARSVPDALRLAPGIDVAQLSSGVYAASPRGFHGLYNGRVLVLVDGRQIYDSLYGGTAWQAWPFQLEDIERIEVIRGPAGVDWGANTTNGVINIITKDPAAQQGLTTTGSGGSQGFQKEHLGYAFQDKKLRMRISGEYEGSDGFREGGSWLRALDDSYSTGRMALHAVYDAGLDDTLTFSGGSGVTGQWAPPAPIHLVGQTRSGAQANFLMAKWDHKIESDSRFELIGYVNDYQVTTPSPSVEFRYQQLALQLNHTLKPAPGHTLTWGIDSRTDLVNAGTADPFLLTRNFVSSALIGLYVQDEWQFAPKWRLNLGGRLDYDFYGGFQPSGRAALSYDLTKDSMLWAAVSRAYQMPLAASRFLDVPMVAGLIHVTGHGDTEAAGMLAYELGYRGVYFDRLKADASVFWHEYADVSAFKLMPGPPGLVRVDVDARADASTYGAELDARYEVSKEFTLLGNYTFEQLNWRSSVNYALGTDLIWPPKHKFMLGARYDPMNDLHLSANLYYVDAVRSPDPVFPLVPLNIRQYFRLDLRAEYEFWKKQASVAVGVRNLLDPGHYEGTTAFMNSAEVPRMVYAEFRMTIK